MPTPKLLQLSVLFSADFVTTPGQSNGLRKLLHQNLTTHRSVLLACTCVCVCGGGGAFDVGATESTCQSKEASEQGVGLHGRLQIVLCPHPDRKFMQQRFCDEHISSLSGDTKL